LLHIDDWCADVFLLLVKQWSLLALKLFSNPLLVTALIDMESVLYHSLIEGACWSDGSLLVEYYGCVALEYWVPKYGSRQALRQGLIHLSHMVLIIFKLKVSSRIGITVFNVVRDRQPKFTRRSVHYLMIHELAFFLDVRKLKRRIVILFIRRSDVGESIPVIWVLQ
jgi:hypothetical protein